MSFVEFIKRVGEKRLAEHSIAFLNEFNKFNNIRARDLIFFTTDLQTVNY